MIVQLTVHHPNQHKSGQIMGTVACKQGTAIAHNDIKLKSPAVFKTTVLPPVFEPLINKVRFRWR